MTANRTWLHLDCKGTMPVPERLCQWLDWLAAAGFGGIIWEYENRLPSNVWPGTFEPGYTLDQWQRIWSHCRKLGLQVVPLVQTLGHLEWLLKHEPYAHLREQGQCNSLCPQHAEVMPKLIAWLDEVLDLHEDAAFIHLGADEVWNLASCPKCRDIAQRSSEGPLRVYLEHVGRLCEYVVARGKRPLIWADMFQRHNALSAARQLPEQVVLVDWDYAPVPRPNIEALKATGHEVWGGTAIRCGFEQKYALAEIGTRLENIRNWQQELAGDSISGLIHTTWGRGDSLRTIYGPWDGWLPAFIAAGDAASWQRHVLEGLVEPLDRAMSAPEWVDLTDTIDRLESTPSDDPLVGHCLRWWALALRHRQLFWATVEHTIGYLGLEAGEAYRGQTGFLLTLLRSGADSGLPVGPVRTMFGGLAHVQAALDSWEDDARAFWRDRGLSDADEYFASRVGNLRCLLERVRCRQ